MYAYKKNLTALFLVYILTTPLQAANILDGGDDQKEVFSESTQPSKQTTVRDHTLLNNKNVIHILDDIEEIEEELGDNLLAVNAKLVTTDNQSPPLLLGVVLQHQQNHKHYQYLIANTGLLSKTTQPNAVTKSHKKGFHLIQATPGHVSLQLLAWLQLSQHYSVITLHTNKPVCRNCYLIASSLWKKQLPTNEKGCFGLPFPVIDEVPTLARQYINSHLHLPLVKSLVVSMMGYVSKEEMQKAMKRKDEQLNDKNQCVNQLTAYLLKNIAAKINRLRTEFDIILDDIDIQSKNSVKSFVQKANVQIKEGRKQLNEDMRTLRYWHKKYKGNDWKYFEEKDKNHRYAHYFATYGRTYTEIKGKMEQIVRNNEKGAIFSSILQSLKTLLSTHQAHVYGVNKALTQSSFKNEDYRSEVARLNAKLELDLSDVMYLIGWRWIP